MYSEHWQQCFLPERAHSHFQGYKKNPKKQKSLTHTHQNAINWKRMEWRNKNMGRDNMEPGTKLKVHVGITFTLATVGPMNLSLSLQHHWSHNSWYSLIKKKSKNPKIKKVLLWWSKTIPWTEIRLDCLPGMLIKWTLCCRINSVLDSIFDKCPVHQDAPHSLVVVHRKVIQWVKAVF